MRKGYGRLKIPILYSPISSWPIGLRQNTRVEWILSGLDARNSQWTEPSTSTAGEDEHERHTYRADECGECRGIRRFDIRIPRSAGFSYSALGSMDAEDGELRDQPGMSYHNSERPQVCTSGSRERTRKRMVRMTSPQRRVLRFFATCGLFAASLAFVVIFTRILLEWTT